MEVSDLCRRAAELHRAGNIAEAERLYRQVLAADPHHFTALHLTGVLCAQAGRRAEALELMQAALRVKPDGAGALMNYGVLLQEMGRLAEARDQFERAASLRPDLSDAFYNLGNVQAALGRNEEALASFAHVLARAPSHLGALNNSAGVAAGVGRLAEALALYDRALAAEPAQAAIWRNRGNLLRRMMRHEEALTSLRRATETEPRSAPAWDDLGAALWELRRIPQALEAAERAIAVDQDYAPAWFHKAVCLLLLGRFSEGWPLLSWRQKLGTARLKSFSQPQWTGRENLSGKTLFIWWEEGLGDTIMLLRFALALAGQDRRVIFSVPDGLKRLLSSAGDAVEIIGAEAVPACFDYHIPAFALPEALDIRLDAMPPPTPYLKAEPALAESWKSRIGAFGFRIGLVWATTTSRSLGRSFPLRELERIAAKPGVRLISLQKQDGLGELDDLPPGMTVEVMPDFDVGGDAFVDSAAIMANLDLVISADTAPAHLAGALGRPAWLALQFAADWRWFLDRDDSVWYPGMRLFRQNSPGDWRSVFAAMEKLL